MNDAVRIRRITLLVTTSSSFLTPFMGSALNVALPTIGKEFGATALMLGWVSTAYLLSSAMFLVPFGKLADMMGKKRVFVWGLALFSLGALLSGLSPSLPWLIAFRAFHGIGGAMIFGTGVAILTAAFPPQERGRVLGINVASVYIGLSVGPFLGGLLTQYLGWRSIFYVAVPLSGLIALLARWKLREEKWGWDVRSFDYMGSLVYGLSLAVLLYGFSRLPEPLGVGLTLAGIGGIGGFFLLEQRNPNPVLELNLFAHNPAFTFSGLAALIHYSATAAVGFLLSLYLQSVRGISPQAAGLILLTQPVIQALFSPLAGWASDRIEPRVVASAGMGLTTLGLLLLLRLEEATAISYVGIALGLLGFGFALFTSPNSNAIMSSVDRSHYGVASAILGTMRLIGQTMSMGIVMLIFALWMGGQAILPETAPLFLQSMRVAFAVFATLCFLGIFASLARGRIHTER
ncbi:MAG: MFS transporter [Anaerolineae bacterium]|nr:MFS transporter [Anaerolineae bacterium]